MTGTGGGVDGGTSDPPVVECPDREDALKILGQPSCTEEIKSLDSDGEYDPETDQCCYKVTTKTQKCGVDGS
jgi:hypothetical protein